jgi:hypothetical protein
MGKLRVNASDFYPRRQHLRIIDSFGNNASHSEKLEIIQAAVQDFVDDMLLDLDISTVGSVSYVLLRGFEQHDVPMDRVTASAHVGIKIPTDYGVSVFADVILPISKGVIYNPSLLIFKGKKYIYSKQFLEKIVGRYKATEVRVNNQFVRDPEMTKVEIVRRPMFTAPGESNTWIDYLNERYI